MLESMHKIHVISAHYWFLITSLRKYRRICIKCHHENKANLFFANNTWIVIKLNRIRYMLRYRSDGFLKMFDLYWMRSLYRHKFHVISAHFWFLITSLRKYQLICMNCHHEDKANLFFANPTWKVIKLSKFGKYLSRNQMACRNCMISIKWGQNTCIKFRRFLLIIDF